MSNGADVPSCWFIGPGEQPARSARCVVLSIIVFSRACSAAREQRARRSCPLDADIVTHAEQVSSWPRGHLGFGHRVTRHESVADRLGEPRRGSGSGKCQRGASRECGKRCVPELRAAVGAHARRRPRALTANMTAWNRWCAIGRRPTARARCIPVAHVTLRDEQWLLARARAPRARRRAARDGRARARRRPPAVASRSRPDLARVRRARRTPAVPRRRPAPACSTTAGTPTRPTSFVPTARLGVPLDRGRARVHRPHPERHARAASRPAHRHRRARARCGCRCS